jgi:hypothetical protein
MGLDSSGRNLTEYGAAAHNTLLHELILGRGAMQTILYTAAKPLWNFRSMEKVTPNMCVVSVVSVRLGAISAFRPAPFRCS